MSPIGVKSFRVIYKLTNLTKEETEAMLDLEPLKGTRFYESVLEQGRQEMKLRMVQGMLRQDFSIQKIAEIFEMDLEEVREIARRFS
ncbi:MAG: Rpn family recombination-promoting nuclease/putative transposase [Oscillatoria sp. SIO1A7]|nr:Rpn family recombination-promoting nuclease/putative transposase [Oscillatoria sp. SIO1A7]